MLRYPTVDSLAVRLNLWGWKSISHTTDMTQTSYIQHRMYTTPVILKLKLREKSDFRLCAEGPIGMLKYSIVALLAVRLNLWGRKAFHTLPI